MKKENIVTDFLIIGAGPAGMITGIVLANAGHKVVVVDKIKQVIRPVCGEYLSPQGVSYLKQMGLDDTLNGFKHIRGMTLYSARGRKVPTDFPDNAYGVALNRKVFHARLLEKLKQTGAEVFFDMELENIQQSAHGYHAQFSNGEISARWIIGADGRQSKTAKLLNFKSAIPTHKKVAIHCFLNPKEVFVPYGQMHILQGGSYIGINPIGTGEINFSIVTDQDAIRKAGSAKELINFWINQRPELNAQFNLLTDEEIKSTSPLTRISLDVAQDGAALIGDASGFIDPLTGEGITTAIKTAHMITEEIQKNQNIPQAFSQYAIRRKMDFAEKEKLNHHFQILIRHATATDIVGLFLNLSQRMRDTFIGIIGNVYTPSQGLKILAHRLFNERS